MKDLQAPGDGLFDPASNPGFTLIAATQGVIASALEKAATGAIRAWHDEQVRTGACVAHGEGQYCCIEVLLGDAKS